MAIQSVTKPMALDETLQGTNTKMDAVIQKLQGIIDALGLDTSVYKPKGNITCAALVPALLIDDNLGNVYNVTDNGTTTSDFVEGAGKPIHVGDNVAIVDIGTGGQSEYKFDLLAGMVDLTNYVQKSATPGLLKNDGTVDTKDYAEKVSSATNGNLAGLNATGNPTDSGISGDMTTQSASGNPISIADLKSAQIALNPVITFEPIQAGSGTPSPSNIRAISGYDKIEVLSAGKNIMPSFIDAIKSANPTITWNGNSFTVNGTTVTLLDNGDNILSGVKLHGTCSSQFYFYLSRPGYNDMKDILKTGFSYTVSPASIQLSDNQTQSLVGTFTIPTTWNLSNCYVYFFVSAGQHENEIIYPMLRDASASGTFEPYHKTTDLSESLGQTVYGGTYDPRTGVFTVDRVIADFGDLNWDYISNGQFFQTSAILSDAKGSSICISSVYTYDIPSSTNIDVNNIAGVTSSKYLRVRDTRYTDAVTFKTALTGQKLVYELATPFTIQLTPHEIALSQGYNYISTNGTSISLAYHNGELASLSDVSQLGETVNELNDYLQRSNANSYVDLTTSTYQFPCDGYVVVDSQAVTSGNIRVQLIAKSGSFVIGGIFMHIVGAYQIQTTYVKAGMRARITQDVTGVRKRFIPLIP